MDTVSVTAKELLSRQNMPLDYKVQLSLHRIREWYELHNGMVYVAFSGGKDSTVLLHLVRSLYPEVAAVFCDTCLEFPEIKSFIRTFENVEWLRPKMFFTEVIEKYGWPVVSKEIAQKISEIRNTKSKKLLHKRLFGDNNKYRSGKLPEKWKFLINAPFLISHKCCDKLKKNPAAKYEKTSHRVRFTGEMADDSHFRRQFYLRNGCNAFNLKNPKSTPLSFWREEDIWAYIKENNIPYSKIYDMGYSSTGCIFCAFGVHMEERKTGTNRFKLLKKTHPKLWTYCIEKLGMGEVLDYVGVQYKPSAKQLELPFKIRNINKHQKKGVYDEC